MIEKLQELRLEMEKNNQAIDDFTQNKLDERKSRLENSSSNDSSSSETSSEISNKDEYINKLLIEKELVKNQLELLKESYTKLEENYNNLDTYKLQKECDIIALKNEIESMEQSHKHELNIMIEDKNKLEIKLNELTQQQFSNIQQDQSELNIQLKDG